MQTRYIWLVGIAVVLVIVVVGTFVYASHFASATTQTHTAAGPIVLSPTATTGAATSTGTSASSSSSLKTFQIVPAQTTASYSVYENLIFQNKPNNDAIGTTHSVQGSFQVQTGATPLVEAMTVNVIFAKGPVSHPVLSVAVGFLPSHSHQALVRLKCKLQGSQARAPPHIPLS